MVADVFWSMTTLGFGVVSLLAGVFTAYFGQGRSRGIGTGLVLLGVVVVGLFAWFANLVPVDAVPPVAWSSTMAVDAVAGVLGALVGAAIGAGVFLGSIMKA